MPAPVLSKTRDPAECAVLTQRGIRLRRGLVGPLVLAQFSSEMTQLCKRTGHWIFRAQSLPPAALLLVVGTRCRARHLIASPVRKTATQPNAVLYHSCPPLWDVL